MKLRAMFAALTLGAGGLLAMAGATAGLQFASQGSAFAGPTCPSGWNTYNITNGVGGAPSGLAVIYNNNNGVAVGSNGSTSPYPQHVSNGPDVVTMCTHTTTVCSPACSQGNAYIYDDTRSAYWDGWSATYSDAMVTTANQGTASEFTWDCAGGFGEFTAYNDGSLGTVAEFGSLGGFSNVLGTASGGTQVTLWNISGAGFCY